MIGRVSLKEEQIGEDWRSELWKFFSTWAKPKRKRRRLNVNRDLLLESWRDETGNWLHDSYVPLVWSLSNRLPMLAYSQGYSFVGFLAKGFDPYALVSPDGEIVKVWLAPPSLTELWEKLNEVHSKPD